MNEPEAIERLAALLDGDASAADAPASLAGLLTLASTIRESAELQAPTPDFRDALRAQLAAQTTEAAAPGLVERTRTAWAARNAQLRASTRVLVATMTASGMLGTAGVAAAAQEALPGDALYVMKGWTEQARLLLATSELEEARLHLAFAAERLEELELGADELTTDEIVDLLRRMDESSQAGADSLLQGVINGTVSTRELQAFTESQRGRLSRVFSELPALARPVAQESLALLRAIDTSVTGIVPIAGGTTDSRASSPLSAPVAPSSSEPASAAGSRNISELLDPVEDGIDDTLDLGLGFTRNDAPDDEDTAVDEDTEAPAADAEEEAFESPTDTFTGGPDVDEDGEDGDRDSDSISVGNSIGTLPMEQVAEAVEAITGVQPDTGVVDRVTHAVDSQIP